MGGYRSQRIAEMVHREVAQRLRTEIKDYRLVPVSITHVDVTRDLSRATVHVMPLGGGGFSDEAGEALVDAARQLRGPIGRALRLRHAPEIVFVADNHTEMAVKVTSLLDRMEREREEREGDGGDEAEEEENA